jgi:excisionase family DNA binding protein
VELLSIRRLRDPAFRMSWHGCLRSMEVTMSTKRRVFPKGDTLHTYASAAERMGCSASTCRRLVREGVLPVVRPRPNIVRLPESGIDAYLSACTSGGAE